MLLRVVQQAADERGLAVVHAAGGGEAQQVLLLVLRQKLFDAAASMPPSEVALPLLHLHRAFLVVVDDAGRALGAPDAIISSMISGTVSAVERTAPVQG